MRRRLAGYLGAREHARFLLVGEAPGYRGARVSGVPFTSERQLTGAGPAEATATIVRATLAELELEEDTLCWNAVPTHPGTETANRRPTRAEIESAAGSSSNWHAAAVCSQSAASPKLRQERGTSAIPATAEPRSFVAGCYDSRPADVESAVSMQKTWNAKPGEIERRWYVVDAEGKTLGRLATQIADTLRGKTKPQYTPHVDTGDFVVVVNAEKITVTGNKLDDKLYYRHSGYPGGLRSRPLRDQLERRPTEVIRKAVKGMLPRNRLARQQLNKLKVYAGPDHPHQAQDPQPLRASEDA